MKSEYSGLLAQVKLKRPIAWILRVHHHVFLLIYRQIDFSRRDLGSSEP